MTCNTSFWLVTLTPEAHHRAVQLPQTVWIWIIDIRKKKKKITINNLVKVSKKIFIYIIFLPAHLYKYNW